uniref:PolyADP-ribose glycohydrolase 1-like isoform X2 n=1 Tax=Rhizophora mucronata TaxID=61149 RepID=A0A2P2KS05_RHIMU
MPRGFVSFERKVLPLEQRPLHVSYPKADFWSESEIILCPLKVRSSGFIEDQSDEALEVDFANRYLGGGALKRGCVQEEIRFMINPELIAGMLFLPCMEDNEAIEIVGAERFSNYTGYASSFRFSGNHMDNRDFDSLRRRKTKLIAIDALSNPGMRQYELKCLLRETNKAFCGFLDHSKFDCWQILFQENERQEAQNKKDHEESRLPSSLDKAPPTSVEIEITEEESISQDDKERIGIVTGNWGCGAFGGDPELKTIIQWLAASQALRPYILYYTFGIEALQNLDQVSQWILSHGWTVGELWNMLLAYSSQRCSQETNMGFFTWLLPQSLDDTDMSLKQDF